MALVFLFFFFMVVYYVYGHGMIPTAFKEIQLSAIGSDGESIRVID